MAQQVGSEGLDLGNEHAAEIEEGLAGTAEKKTKQGPRKRVSQACDRCRARKDKCDGKKPTCSTCVTNGRVCSYDANVKKRGLPEGYVRGLEKLWGLAIRDIDLIENNILGALAGDQDSIETPLSLWNDEGNSEILVETWRKSQISRELEKLLSSQEPTLLENFKRRRVDSDFQATKSIGTSGYPASEVNRSNEEAYSWVENPWQEQRLGRKLTNDFQNSPLPIGINEKNTASQNREYESILSPANTHAVSSGTPATVADIPELPSETWHLLDVYFSYTHSWFPIIEKPDLLRASYQYSQNRGASSSTSTSGSGEHAALWATIAYAKFQHRAINNIPRALGAVGEMVWTAERMYAHARSLIPNEEGVVELGHIQALLILTLANMGMGHYSRAWSLIGLAIRNAIDLQLDQSLSPTTYSLKGGTRSKHVFLGCFVLDTLISARLNRRPHLRTADIDSVGILEEDGLEEWDPWIDCLNVRRNNMSRTRVPASILSTFNQLVQVLRILNDVVCLPSTSNNVQATSELLEKLHSWGYSQSPPLYLGVDHEHGPSLLPHQYHLRTFYLATEVTVQLQSKSFGNESPDLEPAAKSGRHMVELLKHHLNTFGLLIVPPTYEYFVKMAYDTVHAVQGSIESTHIVLADWKRSLDNCIDAMEPAWPVLESFKSSTAYHSASYTRRESQVAFDLISGISQDADTPASEKTPQSGSSPATMGKFARHIIAQQGRMESVHARGSPPSVEASMQQSTRRTSSFGQSSSGLGMPLNPLKIYENAHATYGPRRPKPFEQSSLKVSEQRPEAYRQSVNITQSTNPRLRRSTTMNSSDIEFDPMFNELIRLDATEWTGNWDQSLMNLGFTDSDNMNQDFYAFCQEPDPLHQNNVFQQLVANSNAETTDFFDGPRLGGMPLGGFNGGIGLHDESEGIEAGQILQALSVAEDQRAVGRGNG